jgi:hypothetical protein
VLCEAVQPQLLASLSVDGNMMGVAQLANKIYVVCLQSATIRVYEASPPYDRLPDVKVQGMELPEDIAACSVSQHLYIADWHCVWRTEVGGLVDRWTRYIAIVGPWSLSVTSGRLLLVRYNNNKLLQYGDTLDQPKHIPLPRYMEPRHAVETSHGTFIVCHTGRWWGGAQHDQVSEVDVDGRVVRVYGGQRGHGPHQLDHPYHLAQDATGRLLVADTYNRRIVLLNSQLELDRVMVDSVDLDLNPCRLSYVEGTGQLVVGEWKSRCVKVYACRSPLNLWRMLECLGRKRQKTNH